MTSTHQASTPTPHPRSPLSTPKARVANLIPGNVEALQRGRIERQAKVGQWEALDLHADTRLRQDFADAAFMRAHLRAADIRVANSTEPATVPRVRSLLRAVGIQGKESAEAIGCTLDRFLALNKRLPLWAAVALILEATGRFTVRAFHAAGGRGIAA